MTGSPDRDPACYDLTLTGVEQKKTESAESLRRIPARQTHAKQHLTPRLNVIWPSSSIPRFTQAETNG